MEDDEGIQDVGKTTRRQAVAGAAGGVLGLAISPVFYELLFESPQSYEEVGDDIDGSVNQTELNLSSEDYEHFSFDDMVLHQDSANGEVYLGVEVNLSEDDSKEAAELLSEENYLSEGSEIFEIYAQNVANMDEFEKIELGYRSPVLDEEVTYSAEVDEMQDSLSTGQTLQDFYRETINSNIEIS